MWCERRRRIAGECQRFLQVLIQSLRVDRQVLGNGAEHVVLGGDGCARVPVRPAPLGCLRQRDQQPDLRHGQFIEGPPEPRHRRRLDPLHIAPVGCEREIGLQDVGLAPVVLDPQGIQHLTHLDAEGSRPQVVVQQPRHLHRERGSARDDAALGQKTDQRTNDRRRVDADVRAETSIFIGDHGGDQVRIDLLERHRLAPHALRVQAQFQERTVCRQHRHRKIVQTFCVDRPRYVCHERSQAAKAQGCQSGAEATTRRQSAHARSCSSR